jgi:O-antigen/teichoic acid export membrane protein
MSALNMLVELIVVGYASSIFTEWGKRCPKKKTGELDVLITIFSFSIPLKLSSSLLRLIQESNSLYETPVIASLL